MPDSSSWTTPPSLLDVDLLLLKMRQQEKSVLSFEFTLDGMPWHATLENCPDGSATISMMLELAALPFTAEANQRRLLSTVLIQVLNLHWRQQDQDIRLGLSPRRNTVFLLHKITCATTPGLYGLLTQLGQQAVAVQGPLRVLKTCAPWLLAPHKKISSLHRPKR